MPLEATAPKPEHVPKSPDFKVDVAKFKRDGFLVFPGVMQATECDRLKAEIAIVESKTDKVPVLQEPFFDLLMHPAVVRIVSSVMDGKRYAFHHLHADCQRAGTKALAWHHDYEQYPSRDRDHTMVHVFAYLNGLHGTIGDLLLVPGSHSKVVDRYYYSDRGFDDFENTVVLDRLEPGSIVVIHSALVHARRSRPGGETLPRYLIDMSFCQEGRRWPPYLEHGSWKQILRALNARHAERYGKRAFMFEERNFHHKLKDRIIDGLGVRAKVNAARSYLSGDRHKRLV